MNTTRGRAGEFRALGGQHYRAATTAASILLCAVLSANRAGSPRVPFHAHLKRGGRPEEFRASPEGLPGGPSLLVQLSFYRPTSP